MSCNYLRDTSTSFVTPGTSTSSSSIQNRFKYDVFISFRGEDTRKNFVDHLYHGLKDKGIYTYKDDVKIQKGKRISDDLFKSIEDSKFYIIVFSKNYASSSWCLEELVKIMECHKMHGHTAYPVFYDVEPTEVRKQSGDVREAFAKHEKEQAVVKWREALKEAADLAGWELKNTNDGHEAKFIKKIVGEISLELRSINFGFDEKLVGMETRVKDVVSSLEIGIDEVRMIGIKGMGGAGKTTTARAVFDHLSNDFEARSHWLEKCKYAFGKRIHCHKIRKTSGKVVSYAAGLPLTVKVLGSFLCGKDRVEWVDAIERLEKIPLKETMEKLELSYTSLEDEYKEIFLDIACILKGERKEDAIRILESCGFYARNGLKVLEQRSLITISPEYGELVLGMHDHIEEMGKNIVRREHPHEPNKHSRLWTEEEIEDILANDMVHISNKLGTKATRCLKLDTLGENPRTWRPVMKGLRKMKKLQYLDVYLPYYDFSFFELFSWYYKPSLPNSLKYLKWEMYPFLYLPKTFQRDNLVGLEMKGQLWRQGEKKVFENLKFLSLSHSNLTTFDFRITPNLKTLSLDRSSKLKELFMPVTCQKLKYLFINESKLRTFDLGLTPNLETLSLVVCTKLVKLKVPVACPNLKSLALTGSRLRSLDLELIPNLESLNLQYSKELVEINAPAGCLKKVVVLKLHSCVLLEKLPEDLGRLGCLKGLNIRDTGISYLPQSIFGLKGLLIAASSELFQLYDFPSEIRTTTSSIR
ncbi:Toll/interleukin-1 receptor domain-containing protein [Tanacetum coccineum]